MAEIAKRASILMDSIFGKDIKLCLDSEEIPQLLEKIPKYAPTLTESTVFDNDYKETVFPQNETFWHLRDNITTQAKQPCHVKNTET